MFNPGIKKRKKNKFALQGDGTGEKYGENLFIMCVCVCMFEEHRACMESYSFSPSLFKKLSSVVSGKIKAVWMEKYFKGGGGSGVDETVMKGILEKKIATIFFSRW